MSFFFWLCRFAIRRVCHGCQDHVREVPIVHKRKAAFFTLGFFDAFLQLHAPNEGGQRDGGLSARTPVTTVRRRTSPPPAAAAGKVCASCGCGWQQTQGSVPPQQLQQEEHAQFFGDFGIRGGQHNSSRGVARSRRALGVIRGKIQVHDPTVVDARLVQQALQSVFKCVQRCAAVLEIRLRYLQWLLHNHRPCSATTRFGGSTALLDTGRAGEQCFCDDRHSVAPQGIGVFVVVVVVVVVVVGS